MGKKKGKKGKATSEKRAQGMETRKEAAAKEPQPRKAVRPEVDMESLKKPVAEAKAQLELAEREAKGLMEKAKTSVAEAKSGYLKALAPYREACAQAGVGCEFEGARNGSVTERVRFLLERTDKGIKVVVQGRPETEDVIPLAALKESASAAAYAYTDKHLGPKEQIGNKGGGLGNRLRAMMFGGNEGV